MSNFVRQGAERFGKSLDKFAILGLQKVIKMLSQPEVQHEIGIEDLQTVREEFIKYAGGSVTLKLNEDSRIAEVCLSHPEKKNALTGSMMIEFADAVTQLSKWTLGKGVILHTSGDTFCSGADLNMVQQILTSKQGYSLATLMHDTLERFLSLPMLTVALVQGNALGGGAELATAADFRVITPNTNFQFLQTRLGVVTGWGGGTRLVNLVGPTKALQLLTSCQKVTAEEALRIGFASTILKEGPDDPLSQTRDWLSELTSGSSQVIGAMKSIVNNASSKPPTESLKEERKLFSEVWGGLAQKQALKKILK